MQDELPQSQDQAKQVKVAESEAQSLTEQLEEQRKLRIEAEEALAATKVCVHTTLSLSQIGLRCLKAAACAAWQLVTTEAQAAVCYSARDC